MENTTGGKRPLQVFFLGYLKVRVPRRAAAVNSVLLAEF